jgi:hypothetical protein
MMESSLNEHSWLIYMGSVCHFVLSAVPIYVLIAIKAPKCFIKAVDKPRRVFMWKGRDKVNGGSCLVAWREIQRLTELGSLGILTLEHMSWALQIRWLWFKKNRHFLSLGKD